MNIEPVIRANFLSSKGLNQLYSKFETQESKKRSYKEMVAEKYHKLGAAPK